MNKHEFLTQLRNRLSALPPADAQERLNFYSEMIDDGMEEGLSEEESVAAVGSVDEIAAQITADYPVRQPKPERKLSTWHIVLLVLVSPAWISLVAGLWAGVIALWAGFAAGIAGSVGTVVSGAVHIWFGRMMPAAAMIGVGIAGAGLSVFLYYGCKYATEGIVWFTKQPILRLKDRFTAKEVAQ